MGWLLGGLLWALAAVSLVSGGYWLWLLDTSRRKPKPMFGPTKIYGLGQPDLGPHRTPRCGACGRAYHVPGYIPPAVVSIHPPAVSRTAQQEEFARRQADLDRRHGCIIAALTKLQTAQTPEDFAAIRALSEQARTSMWDRE